VTITFRAGRLAPHPADTHPRLRLTPFLTAAAVPAVVDYIFKVDAWPVYLNDQLGDCTIAAQGHMEEAWSCYGRATTVKVTDQDVLTAYQAVSGYRPGHPNTDNGAVMQDVLSYTRKTGLAGHTIAAYAQLDHQNMTEVKTALYHFGHVYVGVNLPQSAMDQFNAGQPWDVVADDGGILGGHAINLGYAADGMYKIVYWGRVVDVTPAWWAKYVAEAWTSISLEWLSAAGVSPEGLDLASLGEAFAQLTGEANPFPNPTPEPPGPGPQPAPSADPLDRALAAALKPWVAERHSGANAEAACAVARWMQAKGL
jgi:hypothetical protein